jgi:hypothetical protein
MTEDGMALVLAAHEPELWQVLATEKCCATCYDVDTDTWCEDCVAVDEEGQPYLVLGDLLTEEEADFLFWDDEKHA